MSSYKNVVVIGASYSGHGVVNELVNNLPTTHRIILIDRHDFALHPVAVVRGVVERGVEEKLLTAPLTQDTVFPPNSIHRLITLNNVVELKKNSVVLEEPFEGSTELSFDKVVLATGASQPFPMRPKDKQTRQEYLTAVRHIQDEIKAAKSIVVVGGGSVGLETAGEIRAAYPDKPITVVHSNSGVLHPTANANPSQTGPTYYSSPPTPPKLSAELAKELLRLNIDVVLNDKVIFPTTTVGSDEWDGHAGLFEGVKRIQLQSGKTLSSDYVFVSIGNRPNSQLVEAADPGAVTAEGKYVCTDEYFKVTTSTPKSPLSEGYYCLGDASSLPGWKTSVAASAQAPQLAANLVNSIKGKTLRKYSPSSVTPMIVPLGKKAGAGTMTVPLFGTITAPGFILNMKANDFFAGKAFFPLFKGSQSVVPA